MRPSFTHIKLTKSSSARGSTTLESALDLTKSIQWEIQAVGLRQDKAAAAEESSRRAKSKANSAAAHKSEIRSIIADIKTLLQHIEDAVPLLNLAITTSGVSLSTSLPPTVSPSRLLQASMYLNACDNYYAQDPSGPVQVGSIFTVSLYMLFAGHGHREYSMRDTTWKEVIHKARVKLVRVPLSAVCELEQLPHHAGHDSDYISGDGKSSEFAYQLEIIEDLDDDRVHTFEDGDPQPGPYQDVQLAGIRESLPIHQISKILYADTGKILNIGNDNEANCPVLLLKRDNKASHPRKMMEAYEAGPAWQEETRRWDDEQETSADEDDEAEIGHQLRRESMPPGPEERGHAEADVYWKFPADLDPEWLAFEVWTNPEESESDTEAGSEQDPNEEPASVSHRPSLPSKPSDADITCGLAKLKIEPSSSPSVASNQQLFVPSSRTIQHTPRLSYAGPVLATQLSTLEMLLRLTSLQEFHQSSHLAIPDEYLSFFLAESNTTGAGADHDQRIRMRQAAEQKVGFDPYYDSPAKRDEHHDQQSQGGYSREGTPHDEYGEYGFPRPGTPREHENWRPRGHTPDSSQPSLLRNRRSLSPRVTPDVRRSSPRSPYGPQRSLLRPLERVLQERRGPHGSPLSRANASSTKLDSPLGTSPVPPIAVVAVKSQKEDDA